MAKSEEEVFKGHLQKVKQMLAMLESNAATFNLRKPKVSPTQQETLGNLEALLKTAHKDGIRFHNSLQEYYEAFLKALQEDES